MPTPSSHHSDTASAAGLSLSGEEAEHAAKLPISESEMGVPTIEITKAKTTKETQYKITPGGVTGAESDTGEKPGENALPAIADRSQIAKAAQIPPDGKRFLLAYQRLFASRSARGELPPLSWGRDGKLVKGLLAQYGYERLLELLERFFRSEDPWIKKRGYALACFPTLLPTLLMNDPAGPAARQEVKRRVYATPVVIHGEIGKQWQQAGGIATAKGSLFERFPELQQKARNQSP